MGAAAVSLPMIDSEVISRGPRLTHLQQLDLCKPITSEEVKAALFDMNDLKAPGIDGFNVYFYKHAWSIVGPDIVLDVKHFFESSFMPK